jgi:hypothetical protein
MAIQLRNWALRGSLLMHMPLDSLEARRWVRSVQKNLRHCLLTGVRLVDTLDNTITNAFNLPEGVWRGAAVDSIRLKRLGETRNIAAIVTYLASPDADWTTGK